MIINKIYIAYIPRDDDSHSTIITISHILIRSCPNLSVNFYTVGCGVVRYTKWFRNVITVVDDFGFGVCE